MENVHGADRPTEEGAAEPGKADEEKELDLVGIEGEDGEEEAMGEDEQEMEDGEDDEDEDYEGKDEVDEEALQVSCLVLHLFSFKVIKIVVLRKVE